jgi:penicillin-binding protein 2
VELSIDLKLQSTAEDALKNLITDLRQSGENTPEGEARPDGSDAEGGAVVVMDVRTGKILACASYPTYSLATFREDYNDILQQPFAPLLNRALQATYPPGSTYKMSMVVAGVNSGAIARTKVIVDEGVYMKYAASGFTPQCLIYTNNGWTHGGLNAMEALRDSCNYFFYVLGDLLDIGVIDETAKALGLGEKTGVELFEYLGHRANPETKANLHPDDLGRWYAADTVMTAIGQSENRFTPMQLCSYTATLANRGTRYKATFLNRVVSSDYSQVTYTNQPEILSTFDISDEAYAAYTEGMRMVATDGTAARFFRDYPIAIAAKTGTAQTDAGNKYSDNGAFVCYAPYDEPEIAVVVYGEKAGHGTTMAQIAKAILDTYFADRLYGNITPGENQVS